MDVSGYHGCSGYSGARECSICKKAISDEDYSDQFLKNYCSGYSGSGYDSIWECSSCVEKRLRKLSKEELLLKLDGTATRQEAKILQKLLSGE
jgi:hypothetical protein